MLAYPVQLALAVSALRAVALLANVVQHQLTARRLHLADAVARSGERLPPPVSAALDLRNRMQTGEIFEGRAQLTREQRSTESDGWRMRSPSAPGGRLHRPAPGQSGARKALDAPWQGVSRDSLAAL